MLVYFIMLPNLIHISLKFWPPKVIKDYEEGEKKKVKSFLFPVLDAHPDHNMPPTVRNKDQPSPSSGKTHKIPSQPSLSSSQAEEPPSVYTVLVNLKKQVPRMLFKAIASAMVFHG